MGVTRVCKRCGASKPLTEFYPNKTAADGVGNVCRACKRARDARYRDRNRERVREQSRLWRQQNPARAKELSREHDDRLRAQILSAYGGKCACCGEAEPDFLTLDHINGGGTEHRRQTNGKVYAQLRRQGFPAGYRILCWNCNWAFAKNGSCPHQERFQDAA